jgi:hypothetical protein
VYVDFRVNPDGVSSADGSDGSRVTMMSSRSPAATPVGFVTVIVAVLYVDCPVDDATVIAMRIHLP